MRLKLCQNYAFTDHADASAVRDNMEIGNRKSTLTPFHVTEQAMVTSLNESIEEEDLVIPNAVLSPSSR